MRWDIFCRVIDNFGDIGVCWRLACQLASRGQQVRLWADDASALTWMAPSGAAGVEVRSWPTQPRADEPGDVVIEAFGCQLPDAFVADMAQQATPPVWINLEYLSAETYTERSHGLRSPQSSGAGRGLDKWFFYPGFGSNSGGLIREDGLMAGQDAFDAADWLHAHGIVANADESRVSLFCYEDAPLPALLGNLPPAPMHLLSAPGAPQRLAAVIDCWPPHARHSPLPWLAQTEFDHLLWSCHLNLVRGEDSLVRAIWAGVPFVWQPYVQQDGAHAAKLEAFLDRYLADAEPAFGSSLRGLWRAWNGLRAWPVVRPSLLAWQNHALRWRTAQLRQSDLCTRLEAFVMEKR